MWKGITVRLKNKRKNDAWVELWGEIWRWHTRGKLAYKSTTNKLVRDPAFIVGRKFMKRGVDRYWWGWEDGSIRNFWRYQEEFIKMLRDRQKPWFTGEGPCFVRSQQRPKNPKITDK